MKLKPQTRVFRVDAKVDEKARTLELSFSSETPVERYFGDEILVHDAKSVRLGRLNNAAPLLFNHNMDDVIGVVESARIGEDRRGHATVRFAQNARGEEIRAMVDDGILRNVSVMYRIYKVEEDTKKDIFRVIDWEPAELSIVSIPADQSVGVGRASANEEIEVETVVPDPPPAHTESPETEARDERAFSSAAAPAQAATTAVRDADSTTAKPAATLTGTIMPEVANAAAGAPADSHDNNTRITAVDAEKQRTQAIRNLCRANKIDDRVETAWIQQGTPLTEVADQLLAVMEQRGKDRPAVATEIGMSSSETKRYSLFRAIRAMHFGGKNPEFIRQAAFELECSAAVSKKVGRETSGVLIPSEILTRPLGREVQEQQQRAMSVVPGTKGGFMVNVENMGFIDILRNRSVAMRMGARVISGLQGNVFFPRQTGKVSVTWQAGEGTSVTAADQALGQLSMTPKTCVALTDVSEQLLRQASPSAEAFVMADLAADVAIDGVDAATINGTGGAQPLGIKNTTGITSGQDSSSATYAKILAFVSTAGGVNAIRGNPGWVTNTAGAARLMQVQRFTSTDTPVWTGNMLDGNLVGFNAMSSEQLSSGNLIFGSWDELVIGEWGVLELSTDNGGTRFNQLQVGIRATWMVDVLLRYPQAFVVSTNLS